ncbi:B-box zinc finger protein 21 [Raphanus sativus]|uniref:B-box zinc finger protein 21-like n=1 Tax=Raphanus sativus TaxID=3726 RepID=A0A9W3C457_RAPSA|nr:B-box zinc finger protein 21-like [Raphanus sativus]KAJ4884580.1 B-box zinc finger protein 21 [Raphanus sativus]
MKIRCDVCDKEEASVFCTADEASLCSGCDQQVHHANKLAFKHLRFSLLYPSYNNDSPICDICQEKKALLFCQQDRAILCNDCDASIHSANEHKKKHDRFLLTGVKLSASSAVYKPTSESSSSSSQDCSVPSKKPLSAPQSNNSKIQPSSKIGGDSEVSQWGSTSTISEYLIDTLPGWHVEDFLDSSLPPFGFSKSGDDDGMLPYIEADDDSTKRNNYNTVSPPSENLRIWVPQIPQTLPSSYTNQYFSQENKNNNIQFGKYNKETLPEVKTYAPIQNMKQQGQNKRWYDDGGFTVPQITTTFTHPPLHSNKKSRYFW